MRNYSLRKVLTLLTLYGMLLALMSCGNPPTQNKETALSGESEKLADPQPLPKACADGSDNTQKISALYADLARLESFDADLSDQLVGRPTPQPDPQPDIGPKNFSIAFEEYETTPGGPKRIIMRLRGKIVGDENPHSPTRKATKLTKLLKFMDRNMRQGCLDAVSLEADPTVREDSKTLNERGFEWWSACEYPNMVCTDGSCRRDCSRKIDPTPSPKPSQSPTASPTP
ncbi:MAG: hypothetical protein ABIR33_16870 [Pyrinomonadaceae bacterium]